MEYDPRREVCWSIVTDRKVAESLQLDEFSLKLYLWNDSKVSKGSIRYLALSVFNYFIDVTSILGVQRLLHFQKNNQMGPRTRSNVDSVAIFYKCA